MNRLKDAIAIILLSLSAALSAQPDIAHQQQWHTLLNQLAMAKGYEWVSEDKKPIVNPYGSYGSSFVMDFIEAPQIERSVLFLARKKNAAFKCKAAYQPLDLIRMYDYVYIFAIKNKNHPDYTIKKVLTDGVTLKGLSLYYGPLHLEESLLKPYSDQPGIEFSKFDQRQLSIPIVISSVSSTEYLFYYQGQWLRYLINDA